MSRDWSKPKLVLRFAVIALFLLLIIGYIIIDSHSPSSRFVNFIFFSALIFLAYGYRFIEKNALDYFSTDEKENANKANDLFF